MASKRSALVFVVVLALLLGACGGGTKTASTANPKRVTNSANQITQENPRGPWDPKQGLPIADPVQVYPQNGVVNVTLDVKTQTIDVAGSRLAARPWNGQLIGPTIHVKPGGKIQVTFKNKMDQDTNIHYHGLHVSPLGESDNVFRDFKPGSTNTSVVDIPPDHDQGTFWYHVHVHGLSEGQVGGGLSGLLVIDGLEDHLPPELKNITQRQFAIRDVRTNGAAIVLDPSKYSDSDVTTVLVNGMLEPAVSIRQGETQLWRLANIGADLFYDVELPGHGFTVIGEDADRVWTVHTESHLLIPPGKRFDVLVQGGAPGPYIMSSLQNNGPTPNNQVPLATVAVTPCGGGSGGTSGGGTGGGGGGTGGSGGGGTGGGAGAGCSPAALPTTMMTPEEKAAADLSTRTPTLPPASYTFSFAQDDEPKGQGSLINGTFFKPDVLNVNVPLGSVQDWTLINVTGGPHPFHIHVNDFQVLAVTDANGVLQPYTATGLGDVVNIPARIGTMADNKPGKVVIRNYFHDFKGWFVFHCHILNHEDDGMMQSIEVLGPGEKPSPPPPGMAAMAGM
ncbi:MAG: multicopper oxidase type 2 [Acidimicrobiales bacterium]|nr:multicopper oxidase type 2 [Acidimicrobiales bacterium]